MQSLHACARWCGALGVARWPPPPLRHRGGRLATRISRCRDCTQIHISLLPATPVGRRCCARCCRALRRCPGSLKLPCAPVRHVRLSCCGDVIVCSSAFWSPVGVPGSGTDLSLAFQPVIEVLRVAQELNLVAGTRRQEVDGAAALVLPLSAPPSTLRDWQWDGPCVRWRHTPRRRQWAGPS